METGRIIISFIAALVSIGGFAQEKTWLWPIEGNSAGENILYVPRQYIDGELIFGELFIGGEEGTAVLAPADATVSDFGLQYSDRLSYSTIFSFDGKLSVEDNLNKAKTELDPRKHDAGYLTGSISLKLGDGRKIHLNGFMPERYYKTGEKVECGQRLGTLHRSYHKIRQASLWVSVSTRDGKVDDPMAPFGLRSTFIPPKDEVVKDRFTAEEAREDFSKIMDVLKEAYPSLHDVVTPERLAEFERETDSSLVDGIDRRAFYRIMRRVQGLVHDSHIYLYPDRHYKKSNGYMPQIFYGWYGDSCVVNMTRREYSGYVGKRIAGLKDKTADSARRYQLSLTGNYDAAVESVKEEELAFWRTSCDNDNCDQTIEFADGETRTFKGSRSSGHPSEFSKTYLGYVNQNRHKGNYEKKTLNDSTAYLGLGTFSLSETATDEIAGYIDSLAKAAVPNLIVDVRNNPGGDVKVLNRILSYLLDEPGRNKGAMNWVPKRGGYASFEGCCLNYTHDMEIFPEYEPMPDGNGYYNLYDCAPVEPDSTVRYRGKLYVLTNAGSVSAATIFPAEIVRDRRGVVVGRETATAYHYMNALKFADIRLPNSGFQFRIPLVKVVYDTTRNERVPYGRGVLPDYPVELTWREIFEAPDSILNYALNLIAENRYLEGEDPFTENDGKPSGGTRGRATRVIAVCSFLISLAAAWAFFRKKKAGQRSDRGIM